MLLHTGPTLQPLNKRNIQRKGGAHGLDGLDQRSRKIEEELGPLEHGERGAQPLRVVRCFKHGEEDLVALLRAAYSSEDQH